MVDPTAEPDKKKEDKITTLKYGESEIKIVRKPKQNKQANDGSGKGGKRKSGFMRRRRSVDEGIAGGNDDGEEAGEEDAGEEASHPHDGVRWTPLKRKLLKGGERLGWRAAQRQSPQDIVLDVAAHAWRAAALRRGKEVVSFTPWKASGRVDGADFLLKVLRCSAVGCTVLCPSWQVVLLGGDSVGKTCLVKTYQGGKWTPSDQATIGVDFVVETIEVDGVRVKLQIWDTAGQERYSTIIEAYLQAADVLLHHFELCGHVKHSSQLAATGLASREELPPHDQQV